MSHRGDYQAGHWLDFMCMVVGGLVGGILLGPLGVFVGAILGVIASVRLFRP